MLFRPDADCIGLFVLSTSALQTSYSCPICRSPLIGEVESFSIEELFQLWQPIKFSESTIAEHCNQATSTRLYSCTNCRLGIFLPQIIGTPSFYAELQRDPSAQYYVENKWEFSEALKDAMGSHSVIELGCGPGNFLHRAGSMVPDVCGTEYNEDAVRVARSKGLKVFSLTRDLADRKGQFDAAFSFHVLEHVADPMSFVEELCSWVKPGGIVGISVPNQDGPISYVNPCVQNMPPHHATRWCLRTFQVAAERLGLKMERWAVEPLIERDEYYYSYFWVKSRYNGKSFASRFVRSILHKVMPRMFRVIFRILALFGKRSLTLLNGQSLYVLMRTPYSSSIPRPPI